MDLRRRAFVENSDNEKNCKFLLIKSLSGLVANFIGILRKELEEFYDRPYELRNQQSKDF